MRENWGNRIHQKVNDLLFTQNNDILLKVEVYRILGDRKPISGCGCEYCKTLQTQQLLRRRYIQQRQEYSSYLHVDHNDSDKYKSRQKEMHQKRKKLREEAFQIVSQII